ncbi:MAG: hypothetical protein ACR5LD_11755 [Symbiopectobacterium sp.]
MRVQIRIRAGYIKSNPCSGVIKFKVVKRDRYITDEEYAAIYDAADDIVKVAMEVAYLCAAHLSDVLGMKWKQITKEGVFIQQGITGIRQIKAWTPRMSNAIDLAKSISAGMQKSILLSSSDNIKITTQKRFQ